MPWRRPELRYCQEAVGQAGEDRDPFPSANESLAVAVAAVACAASWPGCATDPAFEDRRQIVAGPTTWADDGLGASDDGCRGLECRDRAAESLPRSEVDLLMMTS